MGQENSHQELTVEELEETRLRSGPDSNSTTDHPISEDAYRTVAAVLARALSEKG